MKETHTLKKFYGIYTQRLKIRSRSYYGSKFRTEDIPTLEIVKWCLAKNCKGRKYKVTEATAWSRDYRESKSSISVFTTDEVVVSFIKETFQELLMEHQKPINLNHLNVLEDGKTITRQKLFFDKFRFVARIKVDDLTKMDQDQWVGRIQKQTDFEEWASSALESDFKINMGYNSCNIFFNSPKDLMLFKLSNPYPMTIEKIVLISEIPLEQNSSPVKQGC